MVEKLGIQTTQALVIGDSVRRDLGGAKAAGIDCVLVGGSKSEDAVCCLESMLTLLDFIA